MTAAPITFDLEPVVTEDDWRARALCKGSTHLFFPPPLERPRRKARREDRARSLCTRCPVRLDCQGWAREHREYGFWGGETEEERAHAGFRPSLLGAAATADGATTDVLVMS